jgi:hypothetical protein
MTTPTLPTELNLVVLISGRPVPRAWIAVTLPMKSKNPYRLLFGPATADGVLAVRRADIEREVSKVRDLFLMDYSDPAIGWTGELTVHPLNRSDIANVLLAYDAFGATGFYPVGLPVMLTELDDLLSAHEGESLDVDVTYTGGEGARVVSSSRPID